MKPSNYESTCSGREVAAYSIRRSRRPFPRSVATIGFGASLLLPMFALLAGASRPFDVLVAAILVLVPIAMAVNRPESLPPSVLLIFVFNRLIRRLLDYAELEFSAIPPTSLVVPLLGVLMGAAALSDWRSLPRSLRNAVAIYTGAIVYGGVIGVGWGFAMFYNVLNWLAPLGFGLYVAWLNAPLAYFKKLVRFFVVITVAAMAYGWVQWLVVPPWDAFWIVNCGMGSIGYPEPMQCRFFGPLGSPGSASDVATTGVMLLVAMPSLGLAFRGPPIVFLSLSALVTSVRSSWLTAIAFVLAWILQRGRRGAAGPLAALAILGVIAAAALPYLPGAEQVYDRVETIGDLANDRSLQQRANFSTGILPSIVSRPLGYGLGSTGLASARLSSGTLIAFDSGYLQPLFALGIPGTIGMAIGLFRICRPLFRNALPAQSTMSPIVQIAKAMVIAALVKMTVSNFLCADFAWFFWLFVLPAHRQVVDARCLPSHTLARIVGKATW